MVNINIAGNDVQIKQELYNENFKKRIEQIIEFHGTVGNRIIIEGDMKFVRTSIVFEGNNNILFLGENVALESVKITFHGTNSVVYLNKADNKGVYTNCSFACGYESVIYIGKNVRINPVDLKRFFALEHQNIIIGDESLLSNDIFIRTNDAHLVYDMESKKRTNYSGSILIGDHVWLTRGVTINKNVRIGSGTIIGAGSIASNKTFPSNCACGGIPCKVIKKGIFFDKKGTNSFKPEDTQKNSQCDKDDWIYKRDDQTLDFSVVDDEIKKAHTALEKLKVIEKLIKSNNAKNRFAIEVGTRNKKKWLFF